jgi:hypothetical protein
LRDERVDHFPFSNFLRSSKISLGKYGSFKSEELVGKPYGHTYEVVEDGKLAPVQVTLNEIGAFSLFSPCFQPLS